MKKIFEAPAIKIDEFISEDVIMTSGVQTASDKLRSGALKNIDQSNISTAAWSDMF